MAIRVIIGLGNEGGEYEKTYHNVGSAGAYYLKNRYGAQYPKLRFESDPEGYMNVIGVRISALLRKSGVKPEECLVIHDDSDLLIGGYKLSMGGGSAGHKGVQSVIDNFGTEDFWRLRIGIRDPNEKVRKKAETFVLKSWSKADGEKFEKAFESGWRELQEKNLL